MTSLNLEERHLQQDCSVHAGVHATIADHSAGVDAVTLLLHWDLLVVSVEFKISLLRADRANGSSAGPRC